MAAKNLVADVVGEKPDVLEWTEYKEFKKTRFKQLATLGLALQQQKREAEEGLKEIREELGEIMTTAGVKSTIFDGNYVTYVEGRSGGKFDKKVMAGYLIDEGVASGLVKKAIDAATTPGTEYKTVKFKSLVTDGEE